MATLAMQSALAQIYVDPRLRARILEKAPGALKSLGLTPAEAQSIREFVGANQRALQVFTQILLRKRARRLATEFPLTFTLLGSETWAQVCSEVLGSGMASDGDEIDRCAQSLAAVAPWLARAEFQTLVALEAMRATVARAKSPELRPCEIDNGARPLLQPPAILHHIAFHPRALTDWVTSGGETAVPREMTPILIFKPMDDGRHAETRVLRPFLASILEVCDGRRTAQEIVTQMAGAQEDRRKAIQAALRQYAELNVLGYHDA